MYRCVLLLFLWLPVISSAQPCIGSVPYVVDGDTLHVLCGNDTRIVRLAGIDAPEHDQPFGLAAKEFLKGLVRGKNVQLAEQGLDRYGRHLADVILLDDGRNVSQALVRAGYAWWFRRYAPHDTVLSAIEAQVRAAHLGLWVDPNPVPPWVWRAKKKGIKE